MPVFTHTQVINLSVSDVFNTVVDIANFPTWNPTVEDAKKLSPGEAKEGSTFEMKIRGFGWVPQTLAEFERDKRVMIVPKMRMMEGGHRFVFTKEDGKTRIDHELVMNLKGIFVLMLPMVWITGKMNLTETANALQKYLEHA